jgi:hypothetical protein
VAWSAARASPLGRRLLVRGLGTGRRTFGGAQHSTDPSISCALFQSRVAATDHARHSVPKQARTGMATARSRCSRQVERPGQDDSGQALTDCPSPGVADLTVLETVLPLLSENRFACARRTAVPPASPSDEDSSTDAAWPLRRIGARPRRHGLSTPQRAVERVPMSSHSLLLTRCRAVARVPTSGERSPADRTWTCGALLIARGGLHTLTVGACSTGARARSSIPRRSERPLADRAGPLDTGTVRRAVWADVAVILHDVSHRPSICNRGVRAAHATVVSPRACSGGCRRDADGQIPLPRTAGRLPRSAPRCDPIVALQLSCNTQRIQT